MEQQFNSVSAANYTNEQHIIALLEEQNRTLKELSATLSSLTSNQDSNREPNQHIWARVKDFEMSIGSMVAFSFKWLLASIPVGIVLGLIYWAIFSFIALMNS